MIMIASNVTKAGADALSGQDEWAEGRLEYRPSTGRETSLLTKPRRLTEQLSKPEGDRLTSAATSRATAPPPAVAAAAAAKAAPPIAQAAPSQHVPDVEAQRVLRSHFTRDILSDLRKIQRCAREPGAAVYANALLRSMRAMRDRCADDPFVDVVLALHDALAHENRWADLEAQQYVGAYDVLKALAERPSVQGQQAEKAIVRLEELGFETTPFEIQDELFGGEEECETS